MNIAEPTFQHKILTKSLNFEDYRLYLAALEWNLVDPIVIENQEDFKSRQEWREKLEPYHHQVNNLITFCRRLPVTLLADDVGLGKTISAGLVVSELMSRNRISKILIVCPKILIPQWIEELKLKFGIHATGAIGRQVVDVQIPGDRGAVVTTYHTAKTYLDAISDDGYQMLILDEAHKLRNLYGTQKSPQVAIRFQKALAERMFKYVLMLTATPIQNRLWDIYSLVSLLAVARGHENPFGSEGMFARNFILDSRSQARQLVPDKKDEFRRIVYSYMYRTRRAEVKLYFPERIVQLHKVEPTQDEKELITAIAEPIQNMNPLVQVNLLQALSSSPEAFYSQLRNMGINGTVENEVVEKVKSIVGNMGNSAKLAGLEVLINELKKEQHDSWRMVIFTERLETQTSIEIFFEKKGIKCGLINGSTGSRNQDTLEKFRKKIPEINVIISTRAGSEGVNLQVSNVLVNYDLPWNPMIVEQRIGRIQRLASEHKNVVIFNMILQGTFEEYIVGRLMEKLQMASSAIGDIEALLEAAGVDEDDGFEEKIRKLVIDSLAGKDVQEAIRQINESIVKAKNVLKEEEENMGRLLGSSSDVIEVGPRCPKYPIVKRSMEIEEFSIKALRYLNAECIKSGDSKYLIKLNGKNEVLSFDNKHNTEDGIISCKPGVPFFERLVTGFVNNPKHFVSDIDEGIENNIMTLSKEWVTNFDAIYNTSTIEAIQNRLNGNVVLRVNITVAHDSYERLIEVECDISGEWMKSRGTIEQMPKTIKDLSALGLSIEYLRQRALNDEGVFEFCRFYQERLIDELKSVGGDIMKKAKLEADFTPRIEITLVALSGSMFRNLNSKVSYNVGGHNYESNIIVTPSENKILDKPDIKECEQSKVKAPLSCFEKCEISKKNVLKHLLKKSDISGRLALGENVIRCSLTNKNVLVDEVTKSDITNNLVASGYLRSSEMSGKKAEPDYFDICEFSKTEVLKSELAVSQISGKKYRVDQELFSSVSGKRGHSQEFVYCSEKKVPLLPDETEKCEITGRIVSQGILEKCDISGKNVMPSELKKCYVSGKRALNKYFVISSISGVTVLENIAVRSSMNNFCTPLEAKNCMWSLELCHVDDLIVDSLTVLPMHYRFIDINRGNSFKVLLSLLNEENKSMDNRELWSVLEEKLTETMNGGKCKVLAAALSPHKDLLAINCEVKSMLGFKVRYLGLVFSIIGNKIVGNICIGKKEKQKWQRI
jgi:superfamily II DNA or RNA helicase